MKRILALVAMAALTTLTACNTSKVTRVAPYFDGVFEPQSSDRTRNVADNLLELSHGMVSGINDRFQVEDPTFAYNAAINEEGALIDGKDSVLSLTFIDQNEVQISDAFGKRVTLRVQIKRDGTIVAGILSGVANNFLGNLSEGDTAGRFRKGRAYIMYRDQDAAMGQLQVEFDGFKINANFRALAYSR